MDVIHLNLHHAVQHRLLIEFNYADEGIRIVEPYCLGQTLAGNIGLRAFQIDGHSNSNSNQWKMFDLAKAKDIKILAKHFNPHARDEYNIGDKHMKTISIQVY